MTDDPSVRLVEQRIRNRIMEALTVLADGDAGLVEMGFAEYFEGFYDWVPHRDDGGIRPNGAITPDEQAAILDVSAMLDDACDATSKEMDHEAFAPGWPARIAPVAQRALA